MHETSALLLELRITEGTHSRKCNLKESYYVDIVFYENDPYCESTGQWIVHSTANMNI